MNQQQITSVFDHLAAQEQDFNAAVTSQMIVWQKEFQYATQAIENNDLLRSAATTNPNSLRNAIINVAAVGISLNPVEKRAYLVPRKVNDKLSVCLDISFQGLIDLATDTGAILWAQAKVFYENDVYRNTGVDTKPIHEYEAFHPEKRGNMAGVYCTVKTPDGAYLTEEMDMVTLNKIRAKAAPNGPWKYWFDEMSKKAVAKRGAKWWISCAPPEQRERFKRAVDVLNEHEGNVEPLINNGPALTHSETLNNLLTHEQPYVIEGMNIEDWVLAASTKEEFEKTRAMIREMPTSAHQEKMKQLWVKMKNEAAGVNHG